MPATSRIIPHPEQHHAFNYVLFKQGTTYYGKNMMESGQDYSNTDPTALVNEVIAGMTSGTLYVKKELGTLGSITTKTGVYPLYETDSGVLSRKQQTYAYVIWMDGTTIRAESMIGKQDFNGTDFGAVFNSVIGELPVPSQSDDGPSYGSPIGAGGAIRLRASQTPYKYTTTPILNKNIVSLIGEPGAILQPNAAVDGLTIRSPATTTALHGCVVKDIIFYDPTGVAATGAKGLLVLDAITNTPVQIFDNLFENLIFPGNTGGAAPSGVGVDLRSNFAATYGILENLFRRFRFYGGWSNPMFQTAGQIADNTYEDFIIYPHVATTIDPLFNITATARVGAGDFWKQIEFITQPTTGVTYFLLNNLADVMLENFFMDNGGAARGVGIKIGGSGDEKLRIIRPRMVDLVSGIEFLGTCPHTSPLIIDTQITDVTIGACTNGILSDSGDAAIKFVRGGHMWNNTNNYNGNLANVRFRDVGGVNIPVPGSSTVTAGATPWTYANNNGQPEILVVETVNGLSAMSYKGQAGFPTTAKGFPFELMEGDTITASWATTAPVFRKFPK